MSGLKLSTANILPTDAAGLTSIFCELIFPQLVRQIHKIENAPLSI